jgi:hypothetical protein
VSDMSGHGCLLVCGASNKKIWTQSMAYLTLNHLSLSFLDLLSHLICTHWRSSKLIDGVFLVLNSNKESAISICMMTPQKTVKALDDHATCCNEPLELMPGSNLKFDSVVFPVGVRLRFDGKRRRKWGF